MIEKGPQNAHSFHLAGVIPVAGQPLDFNFPWHDSLMPIGKNYLAIEHSVYECAMAGCETIWIVCHREMQPLIRHVVGEWIEDPVWAGRGKFEKRASEVKKQIPIYYIPIHPKDRDRRDCLGWSVLYGALQAFILSNKISKWVVPDKYYVSFPYGILSVASIRKHRAIISDKKNFFMSYKGKTVKDGEYLSFTFDGDDFVNFRRTIRKEGTGTYAPDSRLRDGKYPIDTLPVEERYSARHFPLTTVFKCARVDEGEILEIPWYHNIGTWEGYCQYLSSLDRERINKPKIIKYKEWNPIGVDNIREEE